MPKAGGYDPRAIQALIRNAPRSGDPLAFIATALIESGLRPDAVGDSGHSHGLFQLNDRGRLASYRLTPQQAYDPETNASVSADEFSKYAAKGLRGAQLALAAQRPSDPNYAAKFAAALPQAEAILGYGGAAGGGPMGIDTPPPAPPAGKLDVKRLMMLLRNQRARSLRGIMPAPGFRQELAKLAQQGYSRAVVDQSTQSLGQGLGQIAPAMTGGGDYGWADSLAKQFGLRVSSTFRDPEHNRKVGGSPTSAHMTRGAAADFSGSPEAMRRLAEWAIRSGQAKEVFYDPLGYYWDNGRIVKGAIGGHSDHTHITWR